MPGVSYLPTSCWSRDLRLLTLLLPIGTRWWGSAAKPVHALIVGTGLEASSLLAIPIVPEDTLQAAREICHQQSHSSVGLMCYTTGQKKKKCLLVKQWQIYFLLDLRPDPWKVSMYDTINLVESPQLENSWALEGSYWCCLAKQTATCLSNHLL